jgi:microsomal epoxide hydrolase
MVTYWRESYDWRKAEAEMNQWNHFKTQIEGLEIHYVHIKPETPPHVKVVPLMLMHGWPGSFYEFHRMIPLLTQTVDGVAIELIIPSLPGFGFSETSEKPNFHPYHYFRLYAKLMTRLGFTQFYVHGNSFGGVVGRYMSIFYPNRVLGLHTSYTVSTLSQQIYNVSSLDFIRETGYVHYQSTRPDSLGTGLTDSPAGLLAFMLEKYSGLTRPENVRRPDGGLKEAFSLDDLLTNVMIYWVTNTATSVGRFYKNGVDFENANSDIVNAISPPSDVLFGYAQFPGALAKPPKSYLKILYPNLIHYSIMPFGGHHATFENPHSLVVDFRSFFKKTLEIYSNQNNSSSSSIFIKH